MLFRSYIITILNNYTKVIEYKSALFKIKKLHLTVFSYWDVSHFGKSISTGDTLFFLNTCTKEKTWYKWLSVYLYLFMLHEFCCIYVNLYVYINSNNKITYKNKRIKNVPNKSRWKVFYPI